MKSSFYVLPLLLGFFALFGTGCVSYEDEERPMERRAAATLLTLVDESHQLTPEQLEERRRNIISYLIAEGYIYSGEDLVQSPSYADQIIRAKLALDGSFELTIYRPEHLAHHEVAFDPAGYPVYSYFPGDIGYIGNGFDPYYIPVVPYYGPHDPRHRPWPHRDHDNRPPDRPHSPGPQPDWNRDHPRSPSDDHDRHDGHQGGSPSAPQPNGNRDRRHDRDRHQNNPGQPPPQNPVQPPAPSPVQSPPANPPVQPNAHRHDPDHRSRDPRQSPPPSPPAATPTPGPATTPPPTPQPRQTNQGRFRPELQLQQSVTPSSRPAPTTPPASNQNRTRTDGTSKPTPPPASTPPQQKSVPQPARDQSNKSDGTTKGGTNPDDHRR